MPIKGSVPVVEEEYDFSRPADTARNVISAVVGVSILFGVVAAAQAVFNRASEQTNAVSEMEAF